MPRILLLSNPRSGSTHLGQLLDSHPECSLSPELLNQEEKIDGNPLVYVENIISKFPETFVGFKVFPRQIFDRNLRFDDLVKHMGATHVIVLWRENVIKNFVSLRIAELTDVWYENDDKKKKGSEELEKLHVSLQDVNEMLRFQEEEWGKIGEQWPVGVQPIFIKFEDFVLDADKWVRYIFSRLSCEIPADFHFRSDSTRQPAGNLSEKISNWSEIADEVGNLKIDVAGLLLQKIKASLSLPARVSSLAPDREPCMPSGGWRYRVADPFMPTQLKQNVFDAVSSGSISSAGFYPRLMATKLKAFFGVPVAQPCSNGFTALLLALQAVNIGKDDEVILPSMTMVAVANAVAFLGARPVFVDCTQDNYNPGWSEIENAITKSTKAIIVTHTYGVPSPDMEKITEECNSRALWLIEDISECVGVKVATSDGGEKLLGTFGHFAGASMYVNKMIHAGDGGFVISKDAKFSSRLASLVNHGFTPSYHFVHFEVAANAKINGLGAAMACGCIEKIEKVMEHRKLVADIYRTLLRSVPLKLMPICGPQDTPWVFGVECGSKTQRTELRAFLAENGIETRDFFFPLHLQPAFEDLPKEKMMPNCENFGSTGFYLPTHSNLEMKDLYYISSVVSAFFTEDKHLSVKLLDPAPMKKQKMAVQIKPDSFKVEVRSYDPSGGLDTIVGPNSHLYMNAVRLALDAEEYLIYEKWDSFNLFVSNAKVLMEEAKQEGLPFFQEYFTPYLKYFQSQMKLEQLDFDRPWLKVNLKSNNYFPAASIPTTTDEETLQLLVWLVTEMKPETIWEIGTWFGHSTFLMAAAGVEANCQRQRIFACDAFMWQNWMAKFANMDKIIEGTSFKSEFLKNTQKYQDKIQAVDWPYDIQQLPEILRNQKPNLIFLDITQEDEDLEELWRMVQGNLIEDETIIVFNGITLSSIPFFTRHADQLVPIAKPYTIAKVFRYVTNEIPKPFYIGEEPEEEFIPSPLPRKFNFTAAPNWEHHHNNLFGRAIEILHKKFHADDAETVFVAAVEETMCDHPEVFVDNPWVGIIHSVPVYKEIFYAPDLQRLCTRNYAKLMKRCKGLFTLTKFQAKYLSDKLPKELSFPIQPLFYPFEEIENPKPSLVPELWREGKILDLILIGSFARDYEMFFSTQVPSNLKKVLLEGDTMAKEAAKRAPKDVAIRGRLSAEEYEDTLRQSIVFLSLKYDGAANTLILECIARNLPIVAPNLKCCVYYLGSGYPLLYNQEKPNLVEMISLKNITKAINYLERMDKSKFHPNKFVESIESGAVMLSLPPYIKSNSIFDNKIPSFSKFDVTISICSYKRTHHLQKILDSLWNKQDFQGKMQIIIWNNNDCRSATVRSICNTYVQKSSPEKSLEIINSTTNYYCSVRFAMPHLMKSDFLLICDDDILPNENFISFFMTAREKYPNDVLCLRGHKFFQHKLNVENPTDVWNDYDNLKFHNDDDPEELIHFVHADACLIPKSCLEQVASVKMPDPSFALVDDYWMSFLLNHRFGRKLRKLSTKNSEIPPFERTSDSDTVGLALHTRPEVHDARIQLYIHHMVQGWPSWPSVNVSTPSKIDTEQIEKEKRDIWNGSFIGYNISSTIDEIGIEDLHKMGVSCVRIGAVGVGKQIDSEFSAFLSFPDAAAEELKNLHRTVELLAAKNISVVLTLHRKIASSQTWKMIAKHFCNNKFVVGYDIINEPYTATEKEICWSEVATTSDPDIPAAQQTFIELINSIRIVDKITPIIIESTFWGHLDALEKLPIAELLNVDPELIFSFHFYEPMFLTERLQNKGRFSFPGNVPLYDNTPYSETIYWDEEFIRSKLKRSVAWAEKYGVKLFLGEFGINRDVPGAEDYLRTIMDSCKELGIIGFLFSFRDNDWEAMDYELGTEENNILVAPNWHEGLMKVVVDGIRGETYFQ